MVKKYELLSDDTIMVSGHRLFRIRANVSFAYVKAGEKGGYIESEENLSHEGGAWVYHDAIVYENAIVYGNARVSGNAKISGFVHIYGNAIVCENAVIDEVASVHEHAYVSGEARVNGVACIRGHAQVSGKATISKGVNISGYAKIYGNAEVFGDMHHLYIYPIGSRDDAITFVRTSEHKIAVAVGCFRGDIDQFEAQVKATHGENEHTKAYMLAAQLARTRIDLS